MSFDEFAKAVARIEDTRADPHFRSQHTFLFSKDGHCNAEFIGRFEHLHEDLEFVAQRLGVDFEIPHLLKSRRLGWEDYYTEGLREIVFERYRRDFELFDRVAEEGKLRDGGD
jgi:hypothetical protein